MKTKRKLKKNIKKGIYLFIALIIVILVIFGLVKYIEYRNSYPYKLEKIGYKKDQIELILKLDDQNIDDILKRKYNKKIISFIKQKYFIYSNLDEYLEYYNKNKDRKLEDVVAIVNVKTNYEPYDEDIVTKTDVSKKELMLVNKYHYLTKDYSPKDIVSISNYYAYGDNEIKELVYKQFKKMWNAAKQEDLTLIITSSYRDYEFQDNLWNSRADTYGEEVADSGTARAGFSEHQTGYTLDIVTYNSQLNDFENTDEFKWLQNNAHKYGFILRYPKDKEEITGYDYESWHYRYVGEETATKIKKLGITYDEYYAYFLENH